MALPEWTFKTVPFYLTNPDHTISTWKREGQMETHQWVGTGTVEFSTSGYGEYRLTCQVWVSSDVAATALIDAHLTSGTLTDGKTGTWSNVLLAAVSLDWKHPTGYEGTLEFVRSG